MWNTECVLVDFSKMTKTMQKPQFLQNVILFLINDKHVVQKESGAGRINMSKFYSYIFLPYFEIFTANMKYE